MCRKFLQSVAVAMFCSVLQCVAVRCAPLSDLQDLGEAAESERLWIEKRIRFV